VLLTKSMYPETYQLLTRKKNRFIRKNGEYIPTLKWKEKNASLHIPLSETLKFWLVGAVVLLMIVGALVLMMAYLITRFTN